MKYLLFIFFFTTACIYSEAAYAGQDTSKATPSNQTASEQASPKTSDDVLETTAGLLTFKDGDVLTGELISFAESSGIFYSKRFGKIQFTSDEAWFTATPSELLLAEQTNDTEKEQKVGGSVEINEISGTNSSEESALVMLRPDTWSIGGGFEYDKGKENDELKANLDLRAQWKRTKNEVKLEARSNLKLSNGDKSTDTQRFRANWKHLLPYNVFMEMNGYLERDTVNVEETIFDYMLNQIGAGLGYNFIWTENSSTKVSVLHNRLRLSFLDINNHVYTQAASLAIVNELQITKKVSISQWVHVYFWEDGSKGYDGEADFTYDFDNNLSLILRYAYRDNAFTLDDNIRNQLKLIVRYNF
jgi:hypothetical protein